MGSQQEDPHDEPVEFRVLEFGGKCHVGTACDQFVFPPLSCFPRRRKTCARYRVPSGRFTQRCGVPGCFSWSWRLVLPEGYFGIERDQVPWHGGRRVQLNLLEHTRRGSGWCTRHLDPDGVDGLIKYPYQDLHGCRGQPSYSLVKAPGATTKWKTSCCSLPRAWTCSSFALTQSTADAVALCGHRPRGDGK